MEVIAAIGSDFNDDRIGAEMHKARQSGERSGGIIYRTPGSVSGELQVRFFIEETSQLPALLVASLMDQEAADAGVDTQMMILQIEMLLGMIESRLDQFEWDRQMACSGSTIELRSAVMSLVEENEENLMAIRVHFVRPIDIGLHGVPDQIVGVVEYPLNDNGDFETDVGGRKLYVLQ